MQPEVRAARSLLHNENHGVRMGVAPPEVCQLIGTFDRPPFTVGQVLVVQVEAVSAIFPFVPYVIVAVFAAEVTPVVIV